MNDVQLALLIMGLVIIIMMIIHNWVQLKKNQKRREKFSQNSTAPKINEANDPLFNSSEFTVDDQIQPKKKSSWLGGFEKNYCCKFT